MILISKSYITNYRIACILVFQLLFFNLAFAQDAEIDFVSQCSQKGNLKYGGSDILTIGRVQYLVVVSAVNAGTKTLPMLVRVGKVKADRNALAFINGEQITSSSELNREEISTTQGEETTYVFTEEYIEKIRADVKGFINGMVSGGHWFSEDKQVFYYIQHKEVSL